MLEIQCPPVPSVFISRANTIGAGLVLIHVVWFARYMGGAGQLHVKALKTGNGPWDEAISTPHHVTLTVFPNSV